MEMVHEREVSSEEEAVGELRRGPWTVEEDLLLVNYIAVHGEGRWNSLARCAGLKRTGKSCRLRWLNYLRPDLRRGNITPQEQLLILELHSRWGNRWSKIAQQLPGRTDNEIKNYWRTRVQKHAKQLKCDVNSQQFKDLMRYLWMPRLLERIQSSAQPPAGATACDGAAQTPSLLPADTWPVDVELSCTTAVSSSSASTDGMQFLSPPPVSEGVLCDPLGAQHGLTQQQPSQLGETWSTESWSESLSGLGAYGDIGLSEFEMGTLGESMWGAGTAVDDLWYTQMVGL